MFATQVKIAPPVKAKIVKPKVFAVKQWVKPVVVDSRLGFEVTAYAANDWVKPVAVNQRLGFEVTAYIFNDSANPVTGNE